MLIIRALTIYRKIHKNQTLTLHLVFSSKTSVSTQLSPISDEARENNSQRVQNNAARITQHTEETSK